MSDPTPEAAAEEPTFRILNPPNFLANKTKLMAGNLDDLLKKADALVAGLQGEFEMSADGNIKKLSALYVTLYQPRNTREDGVIELRKICHTLKGEAGSFGYGLISQIADLFGNYLRETGIESQKPEAVKSYIDTFQLVWAQKIKGDGGEIGRQLVLSLMKLNEKLSVSNT